ncbi:intradiol ring-cleavage dioxygenase [Spongiactinospora sp. 9N601]|uniref:intradiol ring-cleavage dioxygenase n=1 Tax=Spongiactinospora sp. 9N601 TaxID=3375149 RepID=UPI0037AEBA63
MRTSPTDQIEQAARERAVTEEVVRSFDRTESERLRQLMASLVRHLHAFARDVRLTEDEWRYAIRYLTETGRICTDTRQEFILLSDVLGLSTLTVGINSPVRGAATQSTVFGPFFVEGSPEVPLGGSIAGDLQGTPCYVQGRVTGTDGRPVAGARIEIWEADEDGFYDVQYADERCGGRAHLFSDQEGRYRFWCIFPSPYPIPADGPVGALLRATARSPMRPAHIHYLVTAPGYRALTTHIFVADGPHLASDAVFGVKESLVVDFVRHAGGRAPDGSIQEGGWVQAEFDVVLGKDDDAT